MEPTLSSGSLVLFKKTNKTPEPGWIVMATVDGRELVKRVVRVVGPKVYLDGDNPRSRDYVVRKRDVSARLKWARVKL